MPPKRPAPPTEFEETPNVFISEPIHDRNSTFIGYYTPDTSTKPKQLQAREDVRSASHRVLAWRLPSDQKTLLPNAPPIYRTGHDDDGEEWAGRKISKLMEELSVSGTIMVARWYGGTLLGPVRFKHIEDVAREAVNAWRRGDSAKKPRVDAQPARSQTLDPAELARRRKVVIQELQRRDESIVTLRALLEQKKAIANKAASSGSSAAITSPSKVLDYTQMPYVRLQALENARDNTMGFLLKSIDKAEAEVKQREEDEKKAALSAAALKAAEDAEELEEAWAEMAQAIEKSDKG